MLSETDIEKRLRAQATIIADLLNFGKLEKEEIGALIGVATARPHIPRTTFLLVPRAESAFPDLTKYPKILARLIERLGTKLRLENTIDENINRVSRTLTSHDRVGNLWRSQNKGRYILLRVRQELTRTQVNNFSNHFRRGCGESSLGSWEHLWARLMMPEIFGRYGCIPTGDRINWNGGTATTHAPTFFPAEGRLRVGAIKISDLPPKPYYSLVQVE